MALARLLNGYDICETLKKIKAHGFDCFFVNGHDADFASYKHLSEELGEKKFLTECAERITKISKI